jgi:hypothetical protein
MAIHVRDGSASGKPQPPYVGELGSLDERGPRPRDEDETPEKKEKKNARKR